MSKPPFLRFLTLRFILIVLFLTAAQIVLAWVLWQRMILLERFFFGDVLLIFGALDGAVGGLTMVRNQPYSASNSPVGVPAFQVQPSEDERRQLMWDEMTSQSNFARYMIGVSLLTIAVSIAVTYL